MTRLQEAVFQMLLLKAALATTPRVQEVFTELAAAWMEEVDGGDIEPYASVKTV